MSIDFHVIIPARMQSSRLPGKLLKEIKGQTIIERVYRQALLADPKSLTIATDDQAIFDVAEQCGASVMMTRTSHQTGTDRLAEVVERLGFLPNDIIVNVQGDEPFIHPKLIRQVAHSLTDTQAPMATLCWPIEDESMLSNPNVVKVVRDQRQHALYFSRSAIPFHRDEPQSCQHVFRHIGLYAYRAAFILDYVRMPVCALETAEALEQLRVLWAGYQIKVEVASVLPLQDVNTLEDLERARQCV